MKKLFYVDLFCGAGGTSTGIEQARLHGEKCAHVIACVNHDPNAIASHAANHPDTYHFTEDIRTLSMEHLVRIVQETRNNYPDSKIVLWASLECTNFSKAKGGMPRDADSRTLAEHLFRYIEALNPDYIQIENVEEFMSWGKLDENGKPISKLNGIDYVRWCNRVQSYGYTYMWRILNAADYGAYTSRKRFFGQFARRGLSHAFPVATYSRNGQSADNLFGDGMHKYKAVREVLDLNDNGESIFGRKKPLCEKTLQRIYSGLIKFVAGGEDTFLVRWNGMKNGCVNTPGINVPCPTVTTQNRLGVAKAHFLSKQFSGNPSDKNISIDSTAGTITCIDHHALVTYYGNGQVVSIDKPSPTVPTHDRFAKLTFMTNEYSGWGQLSSLDNPNPSILTMPKQKIVSCFLMNPQYNCKGSSIDKPCFTLIARMDKMPPYLIQTENGIGIEIFDSDSPTTVKIKKFMALYGIIDIHMRMLKISELKAIMGFPSNYVLIGTQTEQKKFIGNAVEVNQSRVLCEALAEKIQEE